jgi:hypothetical protein
MPLVYSSGKKESGLVIYKPPREVKALTIGTISGNPGEFLIFLSM